MDITKKNYILALKSKAKQSKTSSKPYSCNYSLDGDNIVSTSFYVKGAFFQYVPKSFPTEKHTFTRGHDSLLTKLLNFYRKCYFNDYSRPPWNASKKELLLS